MIDKELEEEIIAEEAESYPAQSPEEEPEGDSAPVQVYEEPPEEIPLDKMDDNDEEGSGLDLSWKASKEKAHSKEKEEPDFVDTTLAAVRQYNTAYSVGRYTMDKTIDIFTDLFTDRSDFNLSEAIDGAISEGDISAEDAGAFHKCSTKRDFLRTKREIRDRDTLSRAGHWNSIIPTIIAGLSDPLNWIPMAAAIRAPAIGKAVIGSLLNAGTSAGLRYSTQETMTPLDIAFETIGAGIFTGALGFAGAMVKSADFKGWTKAFSKSMQEDAGGTLALEGFVKETKKTGSEAIIKAPKKLNVKKEIDPQTAAKELELIYSEVDKGGKTVKKKITGVTKGILLNSPYLKVATSDDPFVRDIGTALLRSNAILTKEVAEGGVQTLAAESMISYKIKKWEAVKEEFTKIYGKFAQTEYAKINNVTPDDFNLQVTRYMRGSIVSNDEVLYLGKEQFHESAIEAGNSQVKFWNELLSDSEKYDTLPVELESIGIKAKKNKQVLTREDLKLSSKEFNQAAKRKELTKNNKTSIAHFTRLYNPEAIYNNEAELRDLLTKSIRKSTTSYSGPKASEMAEKKMSHILGVGIVEGDPTRVLKIGNIAKERSVAITDDLLEKFLVNNPLEVGDKLVRKYSAAIELHRVAEERGYNSWESLLEGYVTTRTKARTERFKLGINQAPEELAMFDKTTNENLKLLADIKDVLRGTYGGWDNPKVAAAVNGIKVWNAMRQLGSVVVSSIADVSVVVNKFGLGDTVAEIARSFKKTKWLANKQDFTRFIAATEAASLDNRILEQTYVKPRSKLDKVARHFFKWSGLPSWDTYWKKVASSLHYGDILDACVSESVKENSLFLRRNRITESMKKRIATMYEKYGYEQGGNKVLPFSRIEDEEVKEVLFSAIHTVANETVITPGAGDIPLLLRDKWGSLLFQYRAFGIAHFNNVVAPQILQKENRNHLGAFIATATVLGAITTVAKYANSGREIDTKDKEFWFEMIKNSGVLGFLYDTGDSMFSLSKEPKRYFANMNPTVDTIVTSIEAIKAPFKKGKMTAYDRGVIKRALPYNNMFYYNRAIKEIFVGKTKKRKKHK